MAFLTWYALHGKLRRSAQWQKRTYPYISKVSNSPNVSLTNGPCVYTYCSSTYAEGGRDCHICFWLNSHEGIMNCGSVFPANPSFVYLEQNSNREILSNLLVKSKIPSRHTSIGHHLKRRLCVITHPVPLSITQAGMRVAISNSFSSTPRWLAVQAIALKNFHKRSRAIPIALNDVRVGRYEQTHSSSRFQVPPGYRIGIGNDEAVQRSNTISFDLDELCQSDCGRYLHRVCI